jgi:serine/threonine-protein kinase
VAATGFGAGLHVVFFRNFVFVPVFPPGKARFMAATGQALEFVAPSEEELQPLFPGYEIQSLVAQGGMGAVYSARQKSLDRWVAIKILPREFGEDEQFRENFEGEAKTMARLNHPNLIAVHDCGEAGGFLFIIMELVEGESLHQAAGDDAIEQREAARLVAGICRGLAHAHRNGILHRDIKLENILLAPGLEPKVVDFGLARPLGGGNDPEEAVYGTPGYSAPEVVANPAAVDQRADIFSAGVVLYKLLTGRLPEAPWQPPSVLVQSAAGLDKIVRRATHPSRDMRYADADGMAEDLEKVVKQLSGPFGAGASVAAASPPAMVGRGASAAPAGASAVATTTGSKLGLIVASAVVGLALVAAWFIVNGDTEEASPAGAGGADSPEASPGESQAPPAGGPMELVAAVSGDGPGEVVPATVPPEAEPPGPMPAPAETPLESLARLQPVLRAGDLTEMPVGSVSRSGSHFLLVGSKLDWDSASWFAQHHGAQMAAFGSAEELAWAAGELKIEEPVWVGLADSGTEGNWFWVDGREVDKALWAPGQPDDTPSADDGEDFAVVLPGGVLDDEAGSTERMFILQWAKSGANPGSLASQLGRTAAALRQGEMPIFPAGSRNIGGSRFLFFPEKTSWEQAAATAKAAGGHLAVPSSAAEEAWISAAMRRMLDSGESCWVGGRLTDGRDSRWAFVTGEMFEFVTWLPESPDGGGTAQPYLRFSRPAGHLAQAGYDDGAGTSAEGHCSLIEWSAPSRRNMPGKGEKGQPANAREWLIDHQAETHAAHGDAHEAFRKKWEKNRSEFIGELEDRAAGPGRGGRWAEQLARWVESFKDTITESGRIPETIPEYARWWLEPIHKDAIEKQSKLWNAYEADFNAALGDYLDKVRAMGERLMKAGKREEAAYLDREVEATSSDHERFHQVLEGVCPPVPEE